MAVLTRPRIPRAEVRNILRGLLFVSPWLIGFIGFSLYPVAASLYYSFTQYNIIQPPRFIGLQNYATMFARDETFRIVLGNTAYMVFLGVPAGLVVAFLLASLLNNEFRLRSVYRTLFFLPAIVPAVAAAEVWRWVFSQRYGLINGSLAAAGLPAIPWLSSEVLAKPSLIIIGCWAQGYAIVIFLAALQDVPRALYDAALVDGANRWRRFRHITIPMCTPAILFVALTGLIGTFQYFTLGWLLTSGGPNQATEFYSIYLYRNAFKFFKMGYASALAWVLFLIILATTLLIFRSSARWVYYGGESN